MHAFCTSRVSHSRPAQQYALTPVGGPQVEAQGHGRAAFPARARRQVERAAHVLKLHAVALRACGTALCGAASARGAKSPFSHRGRLCTVSYCMHVLLGAGGAQKAPNQSLRGRLGRRGLSHIHNLGHNNRTLVPLCTAEDSDACVRLRGSGVCPAHPCEGGPEVILRLRCHAHHSSCAACADVGRLLPAVPITQHQCPLIRSHSLGGHGPQCQENSGPASIHLKHPVWPGLRAPPRREDWGMRAVTFRELK